MQRECRLLASLRHVCGLSSENCSTFPEQNASYAPNFGLPRLLGSVSGVLARNLIAIFRTAVMTVVVAGCGATKYVTTTHVSSTTQTRTVVHTVTDTRTTRITATVAATDASSSTSTPTSASGVQKFSGNGTEQIGTVVITAPSEIEWACVGCSAFSLTSGLSGTTAIAVGSQAGHGTSAIETGTYPQLQVISNGYWAIRIVPQ